MAHQIAMDSQLTLVDASTLQQVELGAQTILEFVIDNMNNTTITVQGHRCYNVESNRDHSSTKVYRVQAAQPEPVLIAHIERSNIAPDKVTLENGEAIRINKWLKSPILASFPVTMDVDGHKYIWKKTFVGQLNLCTEDDPNTPIAWFERSRRSALDGVTSTPAFLAFQEKAERVRDAVLISCLILEHKIRMQAKGREVWDTAITVRSGRGSLLSS